jgi:hypothetical protein
MTNQILARKGELERALTGVDAQMCIRFRRSGEGENEIITTDFSMKDMNYFICLELVQEVALSLRLRRIAPGMRDPHEEQDLLNLEPETKLCITYDARTQDYNYMLKNMTPMDGAIACDAVAATCRAILYSPASLTANWLPDELSENLRKVANGELSLSQIDGEMQHEIVRGILHKMGFSGWVSPAKEINQEDANK